MPPPTATAGTIDQPYRPLAASSYQAQQGILRFLPYIFILSLLIPVQIYIGDFRLTVYRIFLILALIPCALTWLTGGAGKKHIADYLFIAHVLWLALAYFIAHGIGYSYQSAAIYFIEVMGSYLVARCYIRSAATFQTMAFLLFGCVAFLLPFAILEATTGQVPLREFFAQIGPLQLPPTEIRGRMGMDRAFQVFDHPILYGVFTASAATLAFYVVGYKKNFLIGLGQFLTVSAATFFSLSSGPVLTIVLQIIIIGYEVVTRFIKQRWQILLAATVCLYIVIDIISNRTPFHVLVSYMTFDSQTAFNRINIFQYGSAEVIRNPIFGIGMNSWTTFAPSWMSESMDMFWLVLAVRGGLPCSLLFAGALLSLIYSVSRLKIADPRLIAYRRGWMITVVALALVAWSVHLWNTVFCLYLFLIGSGVWLIDAAKSQQNTGSGPSQADAMRPRQSVRRVAPPPAFG